MRARWVVAIALALVVSARVDAQDLASGTYTSRDARVDAFLEEAAQLAEQGDISGAVEIYLQVEERLAQAHQDDPQTHLVTEVSPGIDRGARRALRALVALLPEDGLREWRLSIDPRANLALEQALSRGDPAEIEAVVERYPLSPVTARALPFLAERAFEQGELARAVRVWARLEAAGLAPELSRRAARFRFQAELARGDTLAARDALEAYVAHGGDAEGSAQGGAPSPRELLARVEARGRPRERAPQPFDPGGRVRTIPLSDPELSPELAGALKLPMAHQGLTPLPGGAALLVQDRQAVRRVPLEGGGAWSYGPHDAGAEPGRLEAGLYSPALGPGVAFATLFRNRPARVTPPAGEGEDWKVEREPDWRVVCLDVESGEELWDAASHEAFLPWSRDAEWVSPPLFHEGAVYLTVLVRETDLRAFLLRLEGDSGVVRYASFLASRDGYDHLGLAAFAPAPVATPSGAIVVATGLGAVAAVAPADGEPIWVARYANAPRTSEPALVDQGRRFRAVSPLVQGSQVVIAPVDGAEVLALDVRTGRRNWRLPRDDARWCAAGPGGEVLLLGRRLRAVDAASGRVLFAGPDLGHEVSAPPQVSSHEVLAVTSAGLVRIGLLDGVPSARYAFQDAGEEVGVPWLSPTGQLITAGRAQLNVYTSFSARRADIRARYSGVRVDLLMGELLARRGETDAALEHLSRAAEPGAISETLRLRAREVAFDLLAERAEAAERAGDPTAFLRAGARALGFAWDAAPGARLAQDPPSPAALRLAYRSASLLRRYADRLAEGEGLAWWVRAGDAFQALLRVPPATLVSLGEPGDRIQVDARAYARTRVRELVALHGAQVHTNEDRQAEEEFRLAHASESTRGLERLLERFPASQRAADARWLLARHHERRGRRREATRELERFVRDHPADARLPEALSRLVAGYEVLHRHSHARRTLERLTSRCSPQALVSGSEGATPSPLSEWARPFQARLLQGWTPQARWDSDARANLEPPLRRVHRSRTELEQEGAALIPVGAPWLGPPDVVLLRRGERLELRRVPGLELLLAIDGVPTLRNGELLPTFAGGPLLVVPFADRVEGWDPHTGERRWSRTIELAAGTVRVGDQPVNDLVGGEDAVLVLGGDNQLRLLECATGEPRWQRTLPRRAGGGIQLDGERAFALCGAPATVDAFRLSDGEPAWGYAASQDPGALPRLTEATWLDPTTLAYVEDGRRIVLIDVTTGAQRWRATPEGAHVLALMPTPSGKHVVARIHSSGATGLAVFDLVSGRELWRDEGQGGPRGPGGGGRASINLVVPSDDSVYTFRTSGGATELWSQDLLRGDLRWTWRAPQGGAPSTLIDTPNAILVPRGDAFGQRVSLTVLARGTGEDKQTVRLPGRRLTGQPVVRDGTVVLSTDRGVFCLAHVDEEVMARVGVALGRALAEAPDQAARRERLAEAVEAAGRYDDALALLEAGLLTEAIRLDDYDRLFAQLAALAESRSEDRLLELEVRAMPRPPKIDGELDDWWRPWSSHALSGPAYVQPVQLPSGDGPGRWMGEEDLSADLYMGWDATSFYFALDVRDTTLRPFDSEAERWIGDALLIGIDCLGNGGEIVLGDDVLLSLALTLPKRDEDEEGEADEEDDSPQGSYFVRRKEDGSGVVYEAAVPWALFESHGVDLKRGVPEPGFGFGFNILLTDDDGERAGGTGGPRGALKTLQLTPSILLHADKSRLWQGYIPGRFAKVTLR